MEYKGKVWCDKGIMLILLICMTLNLVHIRQTEAASKIKLSKKTLSLKVGKGKKLKISGTKKKIKWYSNHKNIVSVNKKGYVKAKKKGTAVIIAKIDGKKYKCKVRVKAAPFKVSNQAKKVGNIINKERKANGLSNLTLDKELCRLAMIRAKEICRVFSHDRPNGSSCFTVLSGNDYKYNSCGENIAAGQRSPSQVMEDWMNSTGHRENILNSGYKKVGVALYVNKNASYGYYWVQLFAG